MHCAGCIGVIADPRYPGVRFGGSEPRCPGVTCPSCQEKDAEIARLKGAVRRLSGALTALDRSYASQFSPGHERMTKEVLADPMD